MNRAQELEAKIKQANDDYYNSSPTISDEEYDALKDELKDLDPGNALLGDVGAPVVSSRWEKTKHQIPMSSQDKVNTIEQLAKWMAGRKIGHNENALSLQEKLDGISLSLNYENGVLKSAVTRGDGQVGENIYRNALKFKGVLHRLPLDKMHTCSIRGEIIMLKEDWKKHFPDLSNPRNAASGIARRIDGGGQEHLTFIAYDITADYRTETVKLQELQGFGFKTPAHKTCNLKGVEETYKEYQDGERDKLPYEIDGFVIKVNDVSRQQALGYHSNDSARNPLGQVALKFAHEMRASVIEDVTWEVGLTGRITPLAWITPVSIAGANISRASLHNISNVEKLGVKIGSRVLVSRRNDVIPYIESVLESGDGDRVTVPFGCPKCSTTLVRNGEFLVCNNDECRESGNIRKWVDLLEMDGVGPKVIEALVEECRVTTPADLYKLTIEKVLRLERMGDRSAELLINAIQDKKQAPLHIFLAGLNIPGCGRRVFKNIIGAGYNTLDKVRAVDKGAIARIDGMGEVTAQNVVDGLKKRAGAITALLDVGFVVTEPTTTGSSLSGLSFCFTGKMNTPRNELEKMAQDNGGEIRSVSKGLSYLVMSDANSTSSKATKAKQVGVKIISEKEFLEMVG